MFRNPLRHMQAVQFVIGFKAYMNIILDEN